MSTLWQDEDGEGAGHVADNDWSAGSIKYHTIDFLEDDPSEMTNSRILALWLMKRSAWYNPRLNSKRKYQADVVRDAGKFRSADGYPRSHKVKETPSLAKAWAVSLKIVCQR